MHADERAPSGHTTIAERDERRAATAPMAALAVVVVWCREEPWRLGELLLLPPASSGSVLWFGRGASAPGEPVKTPLGRLRLGRWVPSLPVAAGAISRYQLQLQAIDVNHVLVRNTGRCPLLVDDKPVVSAELGPGDLVQLGQQMLLLCVRRPVERCEESALAAFPFGQADGNGIVGESAAIWELRRQIAAVATAAGHVLVTGTTGTGKELVAQAIHALSARAARPIVSRNAATLPESLVDAELFGNARNYPNPGMAERAGLIGDADGSTLFLDELAELPHQAQAHLLRVLDAGEYQRLGETRHRRSELRLVAATNREASALKHDLLARFTFQIAVPPLECRKEDLPLLVRHLLRPGGGLEGASLAEPAVPLELMSRLLRHSFVAGVRELRSLLYKAILLADSPIPEVDAASAPRLASVPASPFTAQQVQACLDENNGAIERSWRALGLSSRFALIRLIKRYDLEVRRRPGRRKRSEP